MVLKGLGCRRDIYSVAARVYSPRRDRNVTQVGVQGPQRLGHSVEHRV